MTTAKGRCATGYCFIKRSNRTGGRLSRYIPQHTLGCLTRQGVTELVRQVNAATLVQETWILLNMQEGKMVIEFEASDRTELEKWFVTVGESLVLINDHDPVPLSRQIEDRRPGQVTWEYERREPGMFRIRITRSASPGAAAISA